MWYNFFIIEQSYFLRLVEIGTSYKLDILTLIKGNYALNIVPNSKNYLNMIRDGPVIVQNNFVGIHRHPGTL